MFEILGSQFPGPTGACLVRGHARKSRSLERVAAVARQTGVALCESLRVVPPPPPGLLPFSSGTTRVLVLVLDVIVLPVVVSSC